MDRPVHLNCLAAPKVSCGCKVRTQSNYTAVQNQFQKLYFFQHVLPATSKEDQ